MGERRVALVTGANRGIGAEVARQLLGKGFVVFVAVRSRASGEEAVRRFGRVAGEARVVELDAADAASARRVADEVAARTPQLDVLVNNAGILGPGDDSIFTVTSDLLERTLRTNTVGPVVVTQAFLPLLGKGDSPRVVNVSSGGGSLTDMGHWAPAYSISKAALNAVTRQFAAALTGKVAVNSVCPGWVRTDMGGEGATRSVEEGADTIVWLATEAPWTLTGKFLRDRVEVAW